MQESLIEYQKKVLDLYDMLKSLPRLVSEVERMPVASPEDQLACALGLWQKLQCGSTSRLESPTTVVRDEARRWVESASMKALHESWGRLASHLEYVVGAALETVVHPELVRTSDFCPNGILYPTTNGGFTRVAMGVVSCLPDGHPLRAWPKDRYYQDARHGDLVVLGAVRGSLSRPEAKKWYRLQDVVEITREWRGEQWSRENADRQAEERVQAARREEARRQIASVT